jgi:hypothetical protein
MDRCIGIDGCSFEGNDDYQPRKSAWRWIVDKEKVEALEGTRDMLSFVIFALSLKTKYDLEFSEDEERGFKETLSRISDDLNNIT